MESITLKCPHCRDLYFILDGSERKPCVCLLQKRASVYLNKLGPQTLPEAPVIRRLNSIQGVRDARGIVMTTSDTSVAAMNGKLALLLLHWRLPYELISTYDIVEAFLGHDEDLKSLTNLIKQNLLILVHGFATVENKQLIPLIMHVIDQRYRQNRPTWLVARKSPLPPRVMELAAANKFVSIDLDSSRT